MPEEIISRGEWVHDHAVNSMMARQEISHQQYDYLLGGGDHTRVKTSRYYTGVRLVGMVDCELGDR